MDETHRANKWSEDYRGWRVEFKIRVRKGDGALKAGVNVQQKILFDMIAAAPIKYRETGNSWCDDETELEEQVEYLRRGAHGFIDNFESAKDISGGFPKDRV